MIRGRGDGFKGGGFGAVSVMLEQGFGDMLCRRVLECVCKCVSIIRTFRFAVYFGLGSANTACYASSSGHKLFAKWKVQMAAICSIFQYQSVFENSFLPSACLALWEIGARFSQ